MEKFTVLEDRYSVIRFRNRKAPDGRTFVTPEVFDKDIGEFVYVKFNDRQTVSFLFGDCSSEDNSYFELLINDMKKGGEK